MHNVSLVELVSLLRDVLVLVVRLLLGDSLWVDRGQNLVLRELLRLEILT